MRIDFQEYISRNENSPFSVHKEERNHVYQKRTFSRGLSMPKRTILNQPERAKLFGIPESPDDLIRLYSFNEADLSLINQRRGDHNRLGFAVLLCYLRYPGIAMPMGEKPPKELLSFIEEQLAIKTGTWPAYSERVETRREHLYELQAWMKLNPISISDQRRLTLQLTKTAQRTDNGFVLATSLIDMMRRERIIIPPYESIESILHESTLRGTRQVYKNLSKSLTTHHRRKLDRLLMPQKGDIKSGLIWLRQPPGPPKPKHILIHLQRLKTILDLKLPDNLGKIVHQNRLLKIAREGGQMTAQHLRELKPVRRYATIAAVLIETRATLTDEIIDLHNRFMGTMFSKAKRKHAEKFHQSGKAINDKVRLFSRIGRALLNAKQSGTDPFEAIEAVIAWETFRESISEAEKLAQPEEFDYLPLIGDGFSQLRRYTPVFLELLRFKAAPVSKELLAGVQVLRKMNDRHLRKVPENAPISFIRKRWKNLVYIEGGLDRRYYELCVLSELKNSLRSGDIWVEGSRQFKDFEEYLIPPSRFFTQLECGKLELPIETDCGWFLENRLSLLDQELHKVERLAAMKELPDASISGTGKLRIAALDNAVPREAESLMLKAYALLPHLKITELLLEVDNWTGFSRHFKHLKSDKPAEDKILLLTTVLADAINLGLSKMAESCPGTTYSRLSWLQAWHIRDDTYSGALAELVNAQFRHPFAAWWGDGTTSSSDGQNFKTGGRGRISGQINLKYGQEPGVQFYTHISDQYAPFYTRVINTTVRDATHVLDGLLYHESDLRIEEHYTDTAGFTDHLFALMHLLGFRFAPRIRDLADKRLYIVGDISSYPTISGLIGGNINLKHIQSHWNEILRLAASIRQGTVTASLMLRKLGSYPRQNGLAVALRELGRIERTLFFLNFLQNPDMRRRMQIGLNKSESKNALSRAVFLNRLGEIRDRRFENQQFRASGLNLVVAAIALWNTVYLDRAIQVIKNSESLVDDQLLQHLSPMGWEHINLTGDYIWNQDKQIEMGEFRPLRMSDEVYSDLF